MSSYAALRRVLIGFEFVSVAKMQLTYSSKTGQQAVTFDIKTQYYATFFHKKSYTKCRSKILQVDCRKR